MHYLRTCDSTEKERKPLETMGSNESTSSGHDPNSPSHKHNADATETDDRSLRSKISGSEMATAGLAVAGAVAVALVGAAMASGSDASSKRKTMKAPGRDYKIYRDDFEDDPKKYFRDLRKKG